jgi:hypothetical protein
MPVFLAVHPTRGARRDLVAAARFLTVSGMTANQMNIELL